MPEHDQRPQADSAIDTKRQESDSSVGSSVAQMARALIERGDHDPKSFAALIQANPGSRDEVMALLHRLAGNRFASQVAVLAMEGQGVQGRPPDAKHGAADLFADVNGTRGKPPSQGNETSRANSADATAEFGAVNGTRGVPPTQGNDTSRANAADSMTEFTAVNGPRHAVPPTQGNATSRANAADSMTEFTAVNGPRHAVPPTQGNAQSRENAADATREFDAVNGPAHASSQTVVGGSSEIRPVEVDKATQLGDEDAQPTPSAAPKAELGPVRVKASALNVRATPSKTKGNVLGVLHHGHVVTALAREGDWLKIEYKGQHAFIHHDFVVGTAQTDVAAAPAPDAAPAPVT